MIAQGLDPHEVDGRLRKGAAGIVKAGYNLRVLFQGPEQPVTNIGDRLKGTEWGATGQGMGIRGYANATATLRFEGESRPACLSCRLIYPRPTNPTHVPFPAFWVPYCTVLYCVLNMLTVYVRR